MALKFSIVQEDPARMVLEPGEQKDMDLLKSAFGLKKEGDSITLTRGDILGPPDPEGQRPTIGFVLTGYASDNSIEVELSEPATPKAPAKNKKGGK